MIFDKSKIYEDIKKISKVVEEKGVEEAVKEMNKTSSLSNVVQNKQSNNANTTSNNSVSSFQYSNINKQRLMSNELINRRKEYLQSDRYAEVLAKREKEKLVKELKEKKYELEKEYKETKKWLSNVGGQGKYLEPERYSENEQKAKSLKKEIDLLSKDIDNNSDITIDNKIKYGANLVAKSFVDGGERLADFLAGNIGTAVTGVQKILGADEQVVNKTKNAFETLINVDVAGAGFDKVLERNAKIAGIDQNAMPSKLAYSIGTNVFDLGTSLATGGKSIYSSVGGGHLQESLEDGATLEQATIKSDIIGAVIGKLEGTFNKVFGVTGDTALSKVASKSKTVSKFINDLSKTGAGKAALKFINETLETSSEIGEEFAEEILDDVTTKIIYDKTREFGVTADEAKEIAIMTALSTFALRGITGQALSDTEINEAIEISKNYIEENKVSTEKLPVAREESKNITNQNSQIEENTSNNSQNMQAQKEAQQNSNIAPYNNEKYVAESIKAKMQQQIEVDSENFAKQVDAVKNGTFPKNDMLVLGNTPKALKGIGLPDLPITLTQKHLDTIMNETGKYQKANYHNLGEDIVKQLPEAINNPLDVVKSNTKDDSIVLTTPLADKQGRTVIASIKIDGKGTVNDIRIDTNVMTSAYGRNNYDKFMQDNIKNGNLLYDIDRGVLKKVTGERLQLPIRSNSTTNGSNINNSIAPQNSDVNTTTKYSIQESENNSGSFNLSNNASSIDNNTLVTSTEKNSWSRQQAEKKKRRKHYESIIKSNYTTDEAKNIAKELMGVDTYVPESNSKQLNVADERIASTGADSELKSLTSRATFGSVKSSDIAIGERLIQYYSKIGDKGRLQEAIQATAMAGTSAGQTVQAMSMLNHQTPEGQAIWLQRSVDKMNSNLKKARGDNAEQFSLTQDMIEKIVNSENSQDLENNLNEVYKELGQQVTKTTAQKVDAWRYFSMLSAPMTHIRNVGGNTTMAGVQGIKNKVVGVIEGVVSKVNPEMERTHTIKPASKEVKEFAKADIENVADRLGLSENKYNPKTRLENNMRTFKSDIMENTVGKVFELNNKALEAEDGWGLKAGYVKAMSEYMTANNLTPDTITDKQLGKARNYAVQQAKEATFHQDSQLASLLNQLSNKNKFAKFAMDAVVPFKKTPINVAKTGIDYSPIGLINSAVFDTAKLRKGNITVNQYIDNISKGLTGTGIALVGYALADCGVLKASGSDDEDREKFEESRGSQNYSITIGDNTYSLDWLAPSGIPLFIGAECYELRQSSKEKKTSSSDENELYNQIIESATNILDSFANAMNPMAEMSMLSGLTSALKSYDQDSSQMLASIGTNAVKSYVNQFVPTLLGRIAKTTDEYERSTTSTKTGVLPKAIDSTKNQIMSKIPGLRQQLPIKTDTWGNDMKQSENIFVRALENFVLPWNRKELNSTAVDKELLNVYENTGESSVFPDSINKNITINKQKYSLTSEEYAKYKKQYGQTSYKLLDNLVKSSNYKKMSDSEKQFAIDKVYSYANEQIKVDYAKQNNLEYEQSTLSQVINAIKNAKGDTSYYFEYLAQTQEVEKEREKIKLLASSKANNNTKQAIYENSLGKEDEKYQIVKGTFTSNGFDITQYLEYKSQEFTSDKNDDGKTISGSKKKKVDNYINSMKATYTQKTILSALEYEPSSYSDKQLIINYINNLNKTAKEKTEILEKFKGVKIDKNGNISW